MKRESVKGIPVYCRFEKMAAVESLKLHPKNPKGHPAGQLRVYAKIIRGNGWRRAVVVSKRSGFVVKGNGAVLASRAHGIGKVPIEFQAYASEREEWRDLNADNALAALGETDEGKLAELVEGLGDTDQELAGILNGLEDSTEADANGADCIDQAKELQGKWKTKLVELFAIPMRNHTREGDCCYEPFCGSGSQILAGEQLKRRVLAMELDPRYVAVSLERWSELTGEKPRLVD